MQLNSLKRRIPNRKHRQVGRGGKRGKTSGRGTKGQNARAGRKKRPELRDVIKKLPKLRGYFFRSLNEKAEPVKLSILESRFADGETVSPETLLAKGIFEKKRERFPRIKILSVGSVSKKLKIIGCELSQTAKEKILKVGGSVE